MTDLTVLEMLAEVSCELGKVIAGSPFDGQQEKKKQERVCLFLVMSDVRIYQKVIILFNNKGMFNNHLTIKIILRITYFYIIDYIGISDAFICAFSIKRNIFLFFFKILIKFLILFIYIF